jgi:UDP-N-acetyl-D-galactosamine dehydrogenase
LEITSKELKHALYINYSPDIAILKSADIFVITLLAPLDNNTPGLNPLESDLKIVASIMKINSIIFYKSTVYPSCTEEFCVPILEKYSKFKFNKDFFCGYSPERINSASFHQIF